MENVRQAYREGYQRPCIVLPCGGGKSVIVAEMAKLATQIGNRVLFLVHRRELCEQIENTFRSWGVNMDLCKISMIQTIARHLDAEPEPALIITDENHHCLASSYRKVYEHWPSVPCVGVTATPVRLNGGGLGDVNDALVEGVSASWLIEHNYLAPYRYFAPSTVDCSLLRARRGEYAAEDAAQLLMRPKVYGDVIRHYLTVAGGLKAICYCSTIEHSKAVTAQFRAAKIDAAHIDGDTPATERAQIVEDFRQGRVQVLCNVDLISEGFDVPDCGCAILLRPTKSLTLFIQQSMRCMRYAPGKTAVILDHVGNVLRHGLPDDARRWTLEPKPARKKDPDEVQIKQCPMCFFTHRPAPACPACGHVYEKTYREIRAEKEAKLMELVSGYTQPEQCRSVTELMLYAKRKGYKPGWVYFQQKQRGWIG